MKVPVNLVIALLVVLIALFDFKVKVSSTCEYAWWRWSLDVVAPCIYAFVFYSLGKGAALTAIVIEAAKAAARSSDASRS